MTLSLSRSVYCIPLKLLKSETLFEACRRALGSKNTFPEKLFRVLDIKDDDGFEDFHLHDGIEATKGASSQSSPTDAKYRTAKLLERIERGT